MEKTIFIVALTLYGVLAGPAPAPLSTVDAELAEFARGNHLFSTNLYKEIIKEVKGNFVYSPISAEIILALTNEGAVGKTSEELQTGLSLPSNKETTQKALKAFLPKLKSSGETLKLSSANKIFASSDVKPKESFVQVADTIYEAGFQNVNFAANEQAAKTINEWVEDKTNHRIQNLIKKDYLDADTKLVLVNALYFSGKWEKSFEKYATRDDKFFNTKDDVSQVKMMQQTDFLDYFYDEKLKTAFLKMPFQDSNVSFVIALPDEIDGLTKLEQQDIGKLLEPKPFTNIRVDLKFPKFRIETEAQMKPMLQALGVNKIFTPEADLSGLIYPLDKPIYVDRVVQKAFIDVNEDGVEAAASTAVGIALLSAPLYSQNAIKFHCDHPFAFYLMDSSSGVVLFVGRNRKL